MSNKVYIFRAFVRFWHWAQAALIITLLATGFEVHGSYTLFGFQSAVDVHTIAAWSLIGLWIFAIFWHFATGEWRQYVPTLHRVDEMVRFYSSGIFKGEDHPYQRTPHLKHNPLQRLTYLFMLVVVGPVIWVSGLLYLFYAQWVGTALSAWFALDWIALFHTAGAFVMLAFLISHLYLITTGPTLGAHLKAMITGWDEPH